jgi:hypothetical protein
MAQLNQSTSAKLGSLKKKKSNADPMFFFIKKSTGMTIF